MDDSGTQRRGRAARLLLGIAGRANGVRRLRRATTPTTPEFDLAYARTGPRRRTPVVVIPGGPGLGAILPYRAFRSLAVRGGLDLIMVEHRGVGLSRTDLSGRDLPESAMRITEVLDDLAAVLDHEGVERAFIVGSSYGSYLASSFAARHGDRVAGMLLDSALQSADNIAYERKLLRELFWNADTRTAELVRALSQTPMAETELLNVTRAAYELGGDPLLQPLLERQLRFRADPAWAALRAYASRGESIAHYPGFYEFDLAGVIGFRELGYGHPADGKPLDPALTYAQQAGSFPAFAGEPYDLQTVASTFVWPTVLLSGSTDLRTPPVVAARVAETAPEAVRVTIDNGHSALDTHPVALLNAIRWLVSGEHRDLDSQGARLSSLPRRGLAALFPRALTIGAGIEVHAKR